MGKNRGHYCKACGRSRPNENFSGKGHRQHICKDCKREGRKAPQINRSAYDKKKNYLSRAMKNCLILEAERSSFFLFEFQGKRFITRDDFESEIFLYQKNPEQYFVIDESLPMNEPLLETLYKKYYDTLENGHVVEYGDVLANELQEVSKKRIKHVEVILSLNNLA